MVDRKLYKTKLCVLFQRGRCTRQYCNFAHGTAELRGSFNERRDYREGRDLRERLDRRHSPSYNSLGRGDDRTAYSSRGGSPRSAGKRKRKQIDDESDHSGRFSDGTEDQSKERRQTPSDAQVRIREKLREMQSEIKSEERKKRDLEAYLEGKSKEADALSMNINELEMQLLKEKNECERWTSKIKKFLKAHHRYLRSQDEVRRSQGHFQKLAEQLELDVASRVIDDEPTKVNTFADTTRNVHAVSPMRDQINSSPMQRRVRVRTDYGVLNQNSVGERAETGKHRVDSVPRQPSYPAQFKSSKVSDSDHEHISTRELLPPDTASSGKNKAYETANLPPTGIAAHALNEENDVESDDKLPVGATVAEADTQGPAKVPSLPLLPPPVPENAYAQYKGEEATVDIDGADEETAEVDIG